MFLQNKINVFYRVKDYDSRIIVMQFVKILDFFKEPLCCVSVHIR